MLDIEKNRVVTILRPKGLSIIELYEDALADIDVIPAKNEDDVPFVVASKHREDLDEALLLIRDLIEECAEALKLHLDLYEYDLPANNVPSRQARKWIEKANMITIIDPMEQQLAYVTACVRQNPVMSAFLAFRNPQFLDEGSNYDAIEARTVPILCKPSEQSEKQRRIFASCMQWKTEKIQPIIKKALAFPL